MFELHSALATTVVAPFSATTLDHKAALAGMRGDEGLLGELAGLLRGALGAFRVELRDQLNAGHWVAASRGAHRIRGAFGNVQARAAMEVLHRFEQACLSAPPEGAHRLLGQVDCELAQLEPTLEFLATRGVS